MADTSELGKKIDNLSILVTSVSDRLGLVERSTDEIKQNSDQARVDIRHLDDIVTNIRQDSARTDENILKLDEAIGKNEQSVSQLSERLKSLPGPTSLDSEGFGYAQDRPPVQVVPVHVDSSSSKKSPSAWEQLQDIEEINESAAEVQRQFEQLKDGLCKVKLPSDLKVYHSASGIKGEAKAGYNVLKQGIAYQETTAKWLATQMKKFQADAPAISVTKDDFHELFTILLAQANCWRSEYASLLVASNTTSDTHQMYRMLDRNDTVFSDRELKHLNNAIELSTMKARTNSQPPKAGGPGRQRFNNPRWQDNRYKQGWQQNRNFPQKPKPKFGGNAAQSEQDNA